MVVVVKTTLIILVQLTIGLEDEDMKAIGLTFLLSSLVPVALAGPATPLPHSGKSCPTGYYKSGDYCVPRNDATLPAMERQGSSCPSGFRKSGDYCIANKADAPHVIEREGSSCPSGYYRSGKYCRQR